MKTFFKTLKTAGCVIGLALRLMSCRDITPESYTLVLPDVPDGWLAVLGDPCWKLEWLDTAGQKQTTKILPGENAELEIPVTWANPVLAWPFWEKLQAGFFKPAGALFPFDADNGELRLSWEAGVDAYFYWELAKANEYQLSKIPANFDWIRFRELFEPGTLGDAVLKDPWLPDWTVIAAKTIESSFDRRRIVAQSVQLVEIPVKNGPWYGTSPFAEPLFFENEAVFPVTGTDINIWISAEGLLKTTGSVWVFTRWE